MMSFLILKLLQLPKNYFIDIRGPSKIQGLWYSASSPLLVSLFCAYDLMGMIKVVVIECGAWKNPLFLYYFA